MILYKNINDYDEKFFLDSVSENNISGSPKSKNHQSQQQQNHSYSAERNPLNAVDGPVLFEPVLILDLLY